eukprot:CAMPEP_0182597914 /NCGR_PEP_ID=MMETSP1324-20130603/87213_1 /TAXON_ID=236786 /ORGANISM="Florenciella sp., Strain RCC1587" /LENGTH=105 /DNA_ID=CAMNT_0024815703 /DNA_START=156 /DNA_END=470 /DNA_ORIENTATION=-
MSPPPIHSHGFMKLLYEPARTGPRDLTDQGVAFDAALSKVPGAQVADRGAGGAPSSCGLLRPGRFVTQFCSVRFRTPAPITPTEAAARPRVVSSAVALLGRAKKH